MGHNEKNKFKGPDIMLSFVIKIKACVALLQEGKCEMRQKEVIVLVSRDPITKTGWLKMREIYSITVQKARN